MSLDVARPSSALAKLTYRSRSQDGRHAGAAEPHLVVGRRQELPRLLARGVRAHRVAAILQALELCVVPAAAELLQLVQGCVLVPSSSSRRLVRSLTLAPSPRSQRRARLEPADAQARRYPCASLGVPQPQLSARPTRPPRAHQAQDGQVELDGAGLARATSSTVVRLGAVVFTGIATRPRARSSERRRAVGRGARRRGVDELAPDGQRRTIRPAYASSAYSRRLLGALEAHRSRPRRLCAFRRRAVDLAGASEGRERRCVLLSLL